jgi:NAD(P)-dependent dehydrogenase (short-subunit alcohol dehydrogenase family)
MKTILITGTSSGIGKTTALQLARAGHKVYATMRNPAKCPELAAAAAAENLALTVRTLDVDSDESVRDCFAAVLAEGPVDVLVNNAGIERTGPVETTPLADFRECMETNYFGVIRCVQAVLRSMRERKAGLIINVTSVAGKISAAPMGPYSSTKFALEALSEALAQEVKPFGIRVAIVEPGIIDTPMARRIEDPEDLDAVYPHLTRFSGMFAAALSTPTPPSAIADTISAIVEGKAAGLRHPAGPDAAPFLEWRRGMSDEEWVEWGSLDDDAWYARVKADFGMDARAGAKTAGV